MTVDQQSLLEEGDRLDDLLRSYDGDAKLNESFLVLTLVAGALVATLLWMVLELMAQANGLLTVDAFTGEIGSRLSPTLLDLGIALAAGAIATYAKVNPGAMSSMASTVIAVALVPPVYVMGLMLAAGEYADARGAGLLFAANLVGILIGGISVLAIREPYFRDKLRWQRRSRLLLLLALTLASWVGFKLYRCYEQHLYALKRDNAKVRIEEGISKYLKQRTQTFGSKAMTPWSWKTSCLTGLITGAAIKPRRFSWWFVSPTQRHRAINKFNKFRTTSTRN